MTDNLARLALAIASLGLNDRELRNVLQRLRRIPIDDLVEQISSLQHSSSTWPYQSKTTDHQGDLPQRSSRDATVGQRVERLLKVEARLPTAVAAQKLADMLTASGLISKRDIPPLSKKALWIWVDRVVQYVPAKEVLRCATVLRNEFVHSPGADWIIRSASE